MSKNNVHHRPPFSRPTTSAKISRWLWSFPRPPREAVSVISGTTPAVPSQCLFIQHFNEEKLHISVNIMILKNTRSPMPESQPTSNDYRAATTMSGQGWITITHIITPLLFLWLHYRYFAKHEYWPSSMAFWLLFDIVSRSQRNTAMPW